MVPVGRRLLSFAQETTETLPFFPVPVDKDLDHQDEDVECNSLVFFSEVLDAINQDLMPDYVLSIRQHLDSKYKGKSPTIGEPVCGSFNVCFPLSFDDGAKWMIKFPSSGTRNQWGDMSRRALIAEAKTMMFLKKETTIPIPEVFDFSATPDNDLNCPYLLMSYIDGLSLHRVWWGHIDGMHTPEENEQVRHRILEGVASAMKQLGQFTFDKGGSLEFDEDGRPSGIGAVRMVDHLAELNRSYNDDESGTQPIYFEAGPFHDPEDQYLVAQIRRLRETGRRDGLFEMLKALLRQIPEMDEDDNQFDLAHPDLASQNIIVSEDGELRGIIDWDGVAAVPMSVGSRTYPSWLTLDWDFIFYRYSEPAEAAVGHCHEDSPEALKRYRDVYRRFLDEAHPELQTPVSTEIATDITRISHIAMTLYRACTVIPWTQELMQNIWPRIEVMARKGVRLDFTEMYAGMEDGTVGDDTLDDLEEAFEALLHAV